MAEAQKTANPLGAVAGVAGAAGGYLLSQYSGANLLIPGGVTLVAAIVLVKTLPKERKPMAAAAAFQIGHLVWFVAASIFLGTFAPVALDVVILLIGTAWLLARPGLLPILICGLYQLFGVAVNGASLVNVDVGSPAHRALTVHLLWRILAIVALAIGFVRMRKNAGASTLSAQSISPVEPPVPQP